MRSLSRYAQQPFSPFAHAQETGASPGSWPTFRTSVADIRTSGDRPVGVCVGLGRQGKVLMSQVQELQARIRNLPTEEFSELREWFLQLEDELWDQQISTDFKAGKFDRLIGKARKEFAQGKAREL